MKKESISARVKLRQNNYRKDSYNGYFTGNNAQLQLKIKLTNDSGDLPSDTGNFLFREFEKNWFSPR